MLYVKYSLRVFVLGTVYGKVISSPVGKYHTKTNEVTELKSFVWMWLSHFWTSGA